MPPPKAPQMLTSSPQLATDSSAASVTEEYPMYNFRTSVRNPPKTYTTWLDRDPSGNYDPRVVHYYPARRRNHQPDAPIESASQSDCTASTEDLTSCSSQEDLMTCSPQEDLTSCSSQEDLMTSSPQKDLTSCSSQEDLMTCSPQEDFTLYSLPEELKLYSSRGANGQRRPNSDCVKPNRQCELSTPRSRKESTEPPLAPEPKRQKRSRFPAPPPQTVEKASQQDAQQLQTFVLSTRLAHPIQFNFRPPRGDDQIACHWCDSLVYGIIGLGVVHATVFDGRDGRGYVEVKNGHTANGHIPSRMCTKCTSRRVSIGACKSHVMQELPTMIGVVVEPEAQADCLALGQEEPGPFEWCALCPNVAYYACGKGGSFSDDLSSNGSDGGCGCGLRLCTHCMVRLVGNHSGDLTDFLNELFSDPQRCVDNPFGLRADTFFLHPDGELERQVRPKWNHRSA